MKYQIWSLLLLTMMPFGIFADDLSIKDIRSEYKVIRDRLSSLTQIKVELDGYSTDGGEAIGYLDGEDQIRMIRVELYGESGKAYEEYYYLNGALFFAFYESHTYNVPYYVTPEVAKDAGGVAFDPNKTEIRKERYYFSNGKLIRWLDSDKKQQNPKSAEFIESEKSVKDFSDMVYRLVIKNLKK